MSKILVPVSPDGDAMLREVYEAVLAMRDTHDVFVLAIPSECERYRAAGIACAPFRPAGIFGMATAISRLRRTIVRFEPDVVHAHGFAAVAAVLGTVPLSLAKRTIATFHDPQRDRELPRKLVERKLPGYLMRAAALTVTYPSLATQLEERLGIAYGTMRVIPHGVTVDVLEAPLARPPARTGPIVGWNGRLTADRSWEVAIDTLALLRAALPEARLEIAGGGRTKPFIAAYVREKKLADAVTFLGEVAPRELFAAIDVLAVPISRDAMAHAPLEALVAGVPVVAANLGALADVFGPQPAAWLVPDDADGFAEGIRDAWSRIDDAWAGAAAQRDGARAIYARDVVRDAYEALYRDVVRSRAQGGAPVAQAAPVAGAAGA